MTKLQILKRDNLIVEYIKEHKGRKNSVPTEQLAKYLEGKGYKSSIDWLRNRITILKYERHLPICFVNSGGYYWATSKADILPVIADLQGRIEELQRHIEHLNSFIIN